ncbi:L,D-transpeptidase [Natronohydrobacter thiooxidans]|jgi:lipoprotein-anchoring transpeptidase ErfK/SrfK|uniref:L,D-transpeptidase n=1 Tax=Natronohydrobacter thiooxidans TaxID=87172 RepID=UPI001C3182D4|nr:L,D-transpeptidase [Natronohydrobacter thiooxidans]
MMRFSRRGFLASGSAAGAVALAGCEASQTTGSGADRLRFTEDGRPIATTRAEPLSDLAARFDITPISYAERQDGDRILPATGMSLIPPQFHRQVVEYPSPHRKGTILVQNSTRHLYFILDEGHALRYGIAVGREGLTWRGRGHIYRRAEWPTWTPTARMMREDPSLTRFAGGMPGGPRNPLGARALYLMSGGRDQGYRIHGTPEYWLIGQYVSSGCIRMVNHDAIDLYNRVPVGTRVITI